ncbi:MAG: MBL fold metallo-hydrolase [Myxococcales bacterium]|nr:MBL fold metallo-hydrolase [Myxococcales bacterium]
MSRMKWTAAMGTRMSGARLERAKASPAWRGDRFGDVLPREEPKTWSALREMIKGGSPHRVPKTPIPIVPRKGEELVARPESGLRITWLGHSTTLVEIDGHRVLLDPVFGPRSSPFSWAGPKRFHAPPLPLAELPPLDAVVLSHDHYDHLDYPTIVQLAQTEVAFVTPLGVGAHLELWGVDPARITELDWWETHRIRDLELTLTPARHFSGRSLTMSDRDHTLWGGWALRGRDHRVWFSGDTAMFPGFAEIGERLGPFDVAMIESGAYNVLWRDVHIGPEQAVLASELVRAELLLPVHWGTFDLALHGWTEPIERILQASRRRGVRLATPRPGESIEPSGEVPSERWWPELDHQSAADAPLVATGLDESLVAQILALGQVAPTG